MARLVRLTPEAGESDEVTVYVKGFLGRGEEPDHFDAWLDSHRAAAQRHGWSSHAVGYCWPSGNVGRPPIPFASAVKIAWDVYGLISRARRVNVPATLALTAGEEIARLALRFASEYRAAERAADERAETFAGVLAELRAQHGGVRVVAHSLGCRHAIEAISALPASQRPDSVHLCAPACLEDTVAARLGSLARSRTTLYFTPNDLVLRTGFALMAGGTALGASGPEGDYARLDPVDVSEYFQFWTHLEYKRQFGRIARAE
ncbi:MAG: hypothetical protein VX681_08375 [Myxococcota bacterium]|nr:hypothetical protein [Myxococcota bacterium]